MVARTLLLSPSSFSRHNVMSSSVVLRLFSPTWHVFSSAGRRHYERSSQSTGPKLRCEKDYPKGSTLRASHVLKKEAETKSAGRTRGHASREADRAWRGLQGEWAVSDKVTGKDTGPSLREPREGRTHLSNLPEAWPRRHRLLPHTLSFRPHMPLSESCGQGHGFFSFPVREEENTSPHPSHER